MTYLTDREIHVIGIQRTGQHAVTSWIIGHFDHVCYKNNMSQKGMRRGAKHGIQPPYWYFMPSVCDEWSVSDIPDIQEDNIVVLGTEFTKYEVGLNPKISTQREEMAARCGYDGFSRRQDYVLVIRNPYNHYASVLNWSRNKQLSPVKNFSKMWIAMAHECLGNTDCIPDPKIIVCYDDWFSSEEYRRDHVARQLDIELNDMRLNTVMKVGINKSWGSSFDGMKKKDSAQSMDVLNRWKTIKDDPRFIELCQNDELTELADEFGWSKPL